MDTSRDNPVDTSQDNPVDTSQDNPVDTSQDNPDDNRLIQDFDTTREDYPNLSMLWKSYLSNCQHCVTLEDQAVTVLSHMKSREIKDLNKLEILAIYCVLYCDK